jgi:predicted ArsR family transcriptional regulator/anti-sigma regulatory factor (Ser/Thr protein kinase)
MDWFLDSPDPGRVGDMRREFADHPARHASPDQDVAGATLAFAELLNNAVERSGGPVWVSVDWSGATPVVSITDLGPGFRLEEVPPPSPTAIRGRGLAIAASLAKHLDVKSRQSGGSRVEAELPVRRPFDVSIDPPRRATSALPDLTEATADGFDRQTFLRALVVQLAQEVERRDGPAAAELLVAQVGIDIGAQMEAEYRIAGGIEGTLTADQLAECFVRLKHAIDGDFYPLEVTPERIVLANRECPFGEAVQRAPALCRMTSSVFGGIAAENGSGATVLLEERIAVGDHQCRVIVELGTRDLSGDRPGHRYFPTAAES